MKSFAKRLSTLRMAFCYTQKDIHKICKIPQSTLSSIEKGIFTPQNKDQLRCLIDLFRCNKYWLNLGEYNPFANIEGLIHLNKCRSGINEAAALELLSLTKPQKAVFYKKEDCLIFNDSKCYILLFLCKPYDIKHILEKAECSLLGSFNTSLDLNSYSDIKAVIQEDDLLHDQVNDIIKKRCSDFSANLDGSAPALYCSNIKKLANERLIQPWFTYFSALVSTNIGSGNIVPLSFFAMATSSISGMSGNPPTRLYSF